MPTTKGGKRRRIDDRPLEGLHVLETSKEDFRKIEVGSRPT